MRDDVELRRARTRAVLTGTWLAVVAAAGPASLLRTKAPEGWRVPAGPGARALVMAGAELDGERCAALREAVGRLRACGVEGMVGAGGCRTVWPAWANREGEGVRATVVDGAGVIRFDGRWPLTVAGMRAMGEGVLEWDRGRRAFAGSCGLCHGEDGTSEASAEAKSLAGVSTRMSDAEIVEHAERVGAVMVSTWPKTEAGALLTFIRGL